MKICILKNFQLNSIICKLSIIIWMNGLSYDIWRHIWRQNHVSASNKSKYKNSDTIIAFLGRKYVSIQIFSSIRSFVGILTSFEWHFGLSYDTWQACQYGAIVSIAIALRSRKILQRDCGIDHVIKILFISRSCKKSSVCVLVSASNCDLWSVSPLVRLLAKSL